jgi:predicted phage terminase large subunit-like protein
LAQAIAERNLRQSRRECESLTEFVRQAWHVVEPGQDYVHNWHIDALSDHLEAVFWSEEGEGDLTRFLGNVPPGTMKSLLTCVFFPAWVWGPMNRPSKRFLATSHNERNAVRDTLKCRRLVDSNWYQRRWGDRVTLASDQNTKTKFENTATGFRQGVPFTSMTGERADFVILDDPMSVDDALSDADRDAINLTFREALPTRLNNPDRSAIIVIMQRLHEDDTSGVILSGDYGYEHLMLPMRFDPDRRCETSIGFVDPRTEEGELLFPARFPEWVVDRDEMILGPIATAGQMQQSPTPRGGQILKREYWLPWEAEKYPAFEFILASADTAYTEKEENDPSALTVWGIWRDKNDRARAMLIWAWMKHLEMHGHLPDKQPGETKAAYDKRCMPNWGLVQWVAYSCRRFRVDKLLIEGKATGITCAQEIRRLYREESWSIELPNPDRDKVARAHTAEPSFAAGLIYAPDTEWAEKVIAQAETFPKSKYKDLVDSTTQAVTWMRRHGLIAHDHEVAAEIREQLMHRSKEKPLYEA